MRKDYRSFADRFMDEERRRRSVIDDALGVGTFGVGRPSTATGELAKLMAKSDQVGDIARQIREESLTSGRRSAIERAGTSASLAAEAQIRGALRVGMASDLTSLLREQGAFGSRIAETLAEVSGGLFHASSVRFGTNIARELEAISASVSDSALGVHRAFSGADRVPSAVLEARQWLGISDSISELAKPLSAIIGDLTLGDLRERQEKAWLREARQDREFWKDTSDEIASLTVADEGFAERLTTLVRQIAAHLWRNTRARTKKLDLYDVFALLTGLISLGVLVAEIVPDAPKNEGEQQLTEASQSLNRVIDQITDWFYQHHVDVSGLARAETRSPAWVRTGPGTTFSKKTKLPAHVVVAVREMRPSWRLVVYRDPLTEELEEGWIAARLLEIWAETN